VSYSPVIEPFDEQRCSAEFHATGQRCRRRVHEPEMTRMEGGKQIPRYRHVTDPAEHSGSAADADSLFTVWEEYPDD
jgi:hypothetical protein